MVVVQTKLKPKVPISVQICIFFGGGGGSGGGCPEQLKPSAMICLNMHFKGE